MVRYQAGAGLLLAGVLTTEHGDGGFAVRVWDGPKAVMAFAPDPILGWALAYAVLGLLVLAGGTGGFVLAPLIALTGAWSVFAGSALWLGVTSTEATCVGGLAFALIAVGCSRTLRALAAAHAHERSPHARREQLDRALSVVEGRPPR